VMLALLCLTGGSLNGSIGLCFLLNSGILVLCRYNDKPLEFRNGNLNSSRYFILLLNIEELQSSKKAPGGNLSKILRKICYIRERG